MKPFLTDSEFEKFAYAPSTYAEELKQYQLSEAQTRCLCRRAIRSYSVRLLCEWLPLSNRDVDFMLENCKYFTSEHVFNHTTVMTPEQIEFGLNHLHVRVREAAYRHPCCTETQKVKHLLKWGE